MRRKNTQTELNRDRALGCLVGGAVGDALGYAVEFESLDECGQQSIVSINGQLGQISYEK